MNRLVIEILSRRSSIPVFTPTPTPDAYLSRFKVDTECIELLLIGIGLSFSMFGVRGMPWSVSWITDFHLRNYFYNCTRYKYVILQKNRKFLPTVIPSGLFFKSPSLRMLSILFIPSFWLLIIVALLIVFAIAYSTFLIRSSWSFKILTFSTI